MVSVAVMGNTTDLDDLDGDQEGHGECGQHQQEGDDGQQDGAQPLALLTGWGQCSAVQCRLLTFCQGVRTLGPLGDLVIHPGQDCPECFHFTAHT